MNIGKALSLCRTQRGMSKSALANKAGLSVSYLSLLENSKRDPNLSTLEKICHALNVPSSVLLFLASDPEELKMLSTELVEKLSYTALKLIQDDSTNQTELPL